MKEQRKSTKRRPLKYPNADISFSKTFQIRYEKKLSSIAKLLLNSFQDKHIYYAIEDILDVFRSNPKERENLLGILYSPIISLQNNFSIHFFDIWIDEIYINEISKTNKFLSSNIEESTYIIIKFIYTSRLPARKPDSLW